MLQDGPHVFRHQRHTIAQNPARAKLLREPAHTFHAPAEFGGECFGGYGSEDAHGAFSSLIKKTVEKKLAVGSKCSRKEANVI